MSELTIDSSVLDRMEKLGGKQLKISLIRMYLERHQERITVLATALRKHDFETLERTAHSLISSAGNLGGMLVSKLSAELEKAASQRTEKQLGQIHAALETAMTSFYSFLEQELEKA